MKKLRLGACLLLFTGMIQVTTQVHAFDDLLQKGLHIAQIAQSVAITSCSAFLLYKACQVLNSMDQMFNKASQAADKAGQAADKAGQVADNAGLVVDKAGQAADNAAKASSEDSVSIFMPSTTQETFSSVAGVEGAKEELKDVINYLKDPENYQRLGAKVPRGILLVGEPGNGKTALARAVAGEANCPFFSVSGSDFVEKYVGVGAARVRDLFAQARNHSPCIIFIDEIDAVGRHRGSGLGGGNDEREQTLNQLLTEMDGFLTTNSIIVLAATNRPDILDKALLRPGRFDRRVEVPFPDLASREAILKIHAANVKIDPEVDLHKIARGTPGFTGADLANLINEAAILASKGTKNSVGVEDFEEARDKILLGKEWKTAQQTDDDRRVTAYHESGHALVRLLNPEHSDPLYKISIVPRGRTLGVTHSLPEREKFTLTKEEIEAHVMAALGGRAAEEIVFNKVTTGAYSDFKSATSIVRTMVCKYGMSRLGPVVYSNEYGKPGYSNKMGEKIDEEIRRMVEEYYERVCELLRGNRDMLDQLTTALLEKETLYAGEVYELLEITPREDHRFA